MNRPHPSYSAARNNPLNLPAMANGKASEPTSLSDWRNAVGNVASEEELVELCSRFMAGWSIDDLGQIPDRCRPARRIYDGEHIANIAVSLVQADCDVLDKPGQAEMLHRMTAFFREAASRIAELKGKGDRSVPLWRSLLSSE